MYGQGGWIGLIVPPVDTVCEPEMAALCLDRVITDSTRIFFEPTVGGLKEDRLPAATRAPKCRRLEGRLPNLPNEKGGEENKSFLPLTGFTGQVNHEV